MALEVVGILILENNSASRVVAKYNNPTGDLATLVLQREFEKELDQRCKNFRSMNSSTVGKYANVVLIKDYVVAVISCAEINMYIVSGVSANEILLADICENFAQALGEVAGDENMITKDALIKKLDYVHILVDEVCDGQLLFECNANNLVRRTLMQEEESHHDSSMGVSSSDFNRGGSVGGGGMSFGFGGLNFNSVLEQTRKSVAKQLLG